MRTQLITRFNSVILGLLVTLFVTGCSSYAPTTDFTGLSSEAVIQRLGPPSDKYSVDGGFRLVFIRGPFGKHSYFLSFSANDTLVSFEQVLTESRFSQIKPGMTEQEVRNIIGPSKIILGSTKGSWYVWSYRYENSLCRWFQVEFKSDNLVKTAEYGRPPECNVRALSAMRGR